MPQYQNPETSGWWLDRRVPLGLIMALLAQAGSVVWWAASTAQQDRFQDTRLVQTELVLGRYASEQSAMIERLARIETRSEHQLEILKQIQKRLERP